VHERWLALVRNLVDLAYAGSAQLPVLEALGRESGSVRLGQRTVQLTRRHTELLVLLAGHPNGMTTEEIAYGLYGDPGRPASVRTGLCRLRKALGPWIYTERSRVKIEIDADFLVVGRLLRSGRVREAARLYTARLLPRSEAPGVVEARDQLDAWVRSAVMTSGDQEALWTWLGSESGADDALAWKRLLAQLDFADPRRSLTISRLGQLRNALGRAA
jgi:DNA-binding SARP family transcriptional activator